MGYVAKAELERNRGNYDDAKLWAEKAGYFLSKMISKKLIITWLKPP